MSTRIEHSTVIAASVARVWALTLDVESWPDIMPTMTRVRWLTEPPIRVGSQARIKQPALRTRIWTLTTFERERCFAWTTRLLGMTMTGTHRLTATGGGTRNMLTLELEGLLAPLFGMLLQRLIRNALATENEAFKEAAERR